MKDQESYTRIRSVFGVVFILSATICLVALALVFLGAVPFQTADLALQKTTPTLTMTPTLPELTPALHPTLTATWTATPAPTKMAATRVITFAAYTVQRGDTLYSLAKRSDVNLGAIAQLNGIDNLNRIYAGQTLLLPQSGIDPPPASPPFTATPAPSPTASPTATATPTPVPTQEAITSQPQGGGLIQIIDKLADNEFAFATTCFSGISAIVGFLGFASTTALSWQQTSRRLREVELEIKQAELDKARLEVLQMEGELDQLRG